MVAEKSFQKIHNHTPAYKSGTPSSVVTPIKYGLTVSNMSLFSIFGSPAAAYTALHSFADAPACCGVA